MSNIINTHIPACRAVLPGQTVLAVSSVVQFVVDHGADGQRPRIATQEADFASVQRPHSSLYVVQRPLQVGGLTWDPVELQVQQGDTCGEKTVSSWKLSEKSIIGAAFLHFQSNKSRFSYSAIYRPFLTNHTQNRFFFFFKHKNYNFFWEKSQLFFPNKEHQTFFPL